jgi:hypothetical protein
MSNFETFAMVTEGNISTAPNFFVASTEDTLAEILVAGYMDDLAAKVKLNDRIAINYLDVSEFPLSSGESAVYGEFRVNYDPVSEQWSLLSTGAVPSGIASYGVYSAVYTNAGGSATTTIIDDNISPSMVVIANWASSANAVNLYTVSPGAGSLTVVSSADPGVSKLSYIAYVPSIAQQSIGVYSGKYTNAGGSTTITISDANITSSMVAEARFVSQANASIVQKVTVSTGTLTILCSANPGASVVSYSAQLGSSALTALGMTASEYANAGGNATTSISDAAITASSVVTANWDTSANAVSIQKVTPTAGTLTILSSGDPGASSLNYTYTTNAVGDEDENFLVATNNLSDVASASTSLSNLGGLALAGGTMTGKATFAKGTGTTSSFAVTINAQSGVITTEALTTAGGANQAIVLTNSAVVSTSVLLVTIMGGTNTATFDISAKAVYTSAGVATITIYNNTAATALNGTLIIGFVVL